MKKDFMVVLLGSDDNVYGFARSFHSIYGIKPIALATSILEPTKNSKILDIIVDNKLHDEKVLAKRLTELATKLKKEYKKLILIPCSDAYMERVIKVQDSLSQYENKFISFEQLKTFNDKESFYKMCEKYGLAYPKTYICTPKNYKKILKDIDLDYPLILKPNNSNSEEYLNANFDGKEKVYFIDDFNSLEKTIKNIYSSSYKDSLIIQKYVTGDDTNMRVLNVYCDRHGKVKLMSLGQPILEEYHPKTYGNYAAIISHTEVLPIMNDIKRFLEDIHYQGTANFDIKMDANTKKYYLFEINPRPGRSSFFSTCAGKSLASCYVDDLVYDNLLPQTNNERKVLWLNVPFYLVKKYVKNKDILDEAIKLKKDKKIYHTLRYERDASIKRRLVCDLHYARKLHYYPKYYIEKK